MSRWMTITVLVLAAASLMALPVSAQEELTTITDLTVEPLGAGLIEIEGSADFIAAAQEVALDAVGDHMAAPVPAPSGTDLQSATIQAVNPREVSFALTLADPTPATGVPEAISYGWEFRADNAVYTLQAHRSATASELLCGAVFVCPGDPDNIGNGNFRLNVCSTDPDTGQNTCSGTAVDGEITEDAIVFTVDSRDIGARDGATINPGDTAINSSASASGMYWYTNGNGGDTMPMYSSYVVPEAVTRIGIAPAGTPIDQVELTETAETRSSGGFDLELAVEPGEHVVVAQACFGPDNCDLASVDVTVF